jgi:hypothetical protein
MPCPALFAFLHKWKGRVLDSGFRVDGNESESGAEDQSQKTRAKPNANRAPTSTLLLSLIDLFLQMEKGLHAPISKIYKYEIRIWTPQS